MSQTATKKWQPLRQKDENKTKFYTFKNGKINSIEFDQLKKEKKERESSPKKLYHIKKSQTLVDSEDRKKNQTKLWHYKKPTDEEQVEVDVSEDFLDTKYQTPIFEPDPKDTPIKRERSPILVFAPINKKREKSPSPPPPPPKEEPKKEEPKKQDIQPPKRLPPVVVAPVPVKASKAIAPISDSKSFESINKSMKYYRF